jgi:hypothetical protein
MLQNTHIILLNLKFYHNRSTVTLYFNDREIRGKSQQRFKGFEQAKQILFLTGGLHCTGQLPLVSFLYINSLIYAVLGIFSPQDDMIMIFKTSNSSRTFDFNASHIIGRSEEFADFIQPYSLPSHLFQQGEFRAWDIFAPSRFYSREWEQDKEIFQ